MMRHRAHHAQIMADEEIGEAIAALQVAQQVHHLRLHRHVERGGRLVQHDEARLQHHGPRHGDALALAAGEFVRVALGRVGIEPDLEQRLLDERAALGGGAADAMHLEPLLDDLRHRQPRRQARERILEHDLHLAPQRPHGALADAVEPAAVEADRAVAADEAQQREAERGLARAAFADDAEGLAPGEAEVDAIHRLDVAGDAAQQAAADREPHFEVVRLDQDRRRVIGHRRRAFGLGGEQVAGIGVLRPVEDLARAPGLDHLALGHDQHRLGHLAHDAEVVGDQQQRHAEARLELLQQLQDLRLDGDVERGGGLVGDEDVGLVGERHGDHDALALAAGELMWIGVEAPFRIAQPDQAQQLHHPRPRRRRRHVLVQQQRLGDLLLDAVERVQRGHRLLEHHGDAVAADVAHHPLRRADQLLAVEGDAAAGAVARQGVGQELQDRQRRDRLARAALADQRQRLAAVKIERHPLHRLDGAARHGESDGEIAEREEGHGERAIGCQLSAVSF